MPAKKANQSKQKAAEVPVTGITDAILVLDYEGEEKASKEKINREANFICAKIAAKVGRVPKVLQEAEFAGAMSNPANKTLIKIHIVAHGNQEQVGHFNVQPLADYLAPMLINKNKLQSIVVNSCMSGSEGPAGETPFVSQLAASLATKLKNTQLTRLTVRGSDGESFTDTGGHNWTLQDGIKPNYKDNKESEQAFVMDRSKTKDPAHARPKYSITRKSNTGNFSPAMLG